MFRGSRVWPIVAAVYAAINLAGAGYALAMGEIPHAALHVVLLPGTYFFLWLARRNNAQGALAAAGGGGRSGAFDDRLSQLEQSVDAVAIEVERIGEGQRFMTRVMTENAGARPPLDNARVQPDEGERDS